jgi:hypothetical protein
LVVIVLFLGYFLLSPVVGQAFKIYQTGVTASTNMQGGVAAVRNYDLALAESRLVAARDGFERANDLLQPFYVSYEIRRIPVVDHYLDAVELTLPALVQTADSLAMLSSLGQKYTFDFARSGTSGLNQIADNIAPIALEVPTALQEPINKLNYASVLLTQVDQAGLHPIVQNNIAELQTNLHFLSDLLQEAQFGLMQVRTFMSFGEQKTYLILFLNNTELRPGGGFIGMFGLLTVQDGKIINLETDDVYNFDYVAEQQLDLPAPPAKITQYLGVNQWYLRDSNWDPDFTDNAKRAQSLVERTTDQEIDGVIAFTPDMVRPILALLGPIQSGESEYTADNFVDLLQYQVEQEFYEKGIPVERRKDVLKDLVLVVFDRVKMLGVEDLVQIARSAKGSLDKRDMIVYDEDASVQRQILQRGWSGAVHVDEGDYFMVVDANLGSLKTDAVMDKHVSYSIKDIDGKKYSILRIAYNNTGDFTWKTTRYQTYSRVYIPVGSTIVGNSRNVRLVNEPDAYGKKVIGYDVVIEPGDTSVVEIRYELPRRIIEQINNGTYTLYAQRQIGWNGQISVDADFERVVQSLQLNNSEVARPQATNVRYAGPFVRDLRLDFIE